MSEFFPTSIGSWWKYENWRLDSTGTRDSLLTIDSIVVEGVTTIGGREVFINVDYELNATPARKDTNYIALDGGKLLNYLNLDYGDGVIIPWVVYADLNANEWQMVFKDIIHDTLGYRSEYYFNMYGNKGVIQDYIFKDTTIKAQQIFVYSITKGTTIIPNDTSSFATEDETLFLYGKGVGLVYMKFMITKTTFPPITGYETTLLDYYVK
jgi:hypothetical protein